jgi:hypothetical protein
MAAIESCLPIVCVLVVLGGAMLALRERLLATESLHSSHGAAMEAAREMAHPAGDQR